jgi:hypothetical protein
MPGGALQSGPVSALSVVQYAGVRRESQVIRQGDNDEKGFRDRSVGMLSCCMRAIVRSTATSAAARCAAPGGRFTAYAAGDI